MNFFYFLNLFLKIQCMNLKHEKLYIQQLAKTIRTTTAERDNLNLNNTFGMCVCVCVSGKKEAIVLLRSAPLYISVYIFFTQLPLFFQSFEKQSSATILFILFLEEFQFALWISPFLLNSSARKRNYITALGFDLRLRKVAREWLLRMQYTQQINEAKPSQTKQNET